MNWSKRDGVMILKSYRYLDRVIARLRKFFPKGDPVEIATSWGKGFGLMVKKKTSLQ